MKEKNTTCQNSYEIYYTVTFKNIIKYNLEIK